MLKEPRTTAVRSSRHGGAALPHGGAARQQREAASRRLVPLLLATAVLLMLLMLLWQPAAGPGRGSDQAWMQRHAGAPPSSHTPPMLEKLLLVITFAFNVHKLVFLEAVLQTAETYRTRVDVVLVTDNAAALQASVGRWRLALHSVRFWAAEPPPGELEHSHWLTWEHRPAIEAALAQDNYTAVAYLEDDTRLSWHALVSWALDSELLEPLHFTRCFVRTEVMHQQHPRAGHMAVLDWSGPVDLANRNMTVVLDMARLEPRRYASLSKRVAGKTCGSPLALNRAVAELPCVVHRRFFSPPEPFQGLWVASAQQLRRFMQHPYWRKESSLWATGIGSHPLSPTAGVVWGYPERSNSMLNMLEVPPGLASSCLVPFFETARGGVRQPLLSMSAAVQHMRNAYSGGQHEFLALLEVGDALLGRPRPS